MFMFVRMELSGLKESLAQRGVLIGSSDSALQKLTVFLTGIGKYIFWLTCSSSTFMQLKIFVCRTVFKLVNDCCFKKGTIYHKYTHCIHKPLSPFQKCYNK